MYPFLQIELKYCCVQSCLMIRSLSRNPHCVCPSFWYIFARGMLKIFSDFCSLKVLHRNLLNNLATIAYDRQFDLSKYFSLCVCSKMLYVTLKMSMIADFFCICFSILRVATLVHDICSKNYLG